MNSLLDVLLSLDSVEVPAERPGSKPIQADEVVVTSMPPSLRALDTLIRQMNEQCKGVAIQVANIRSVDEGALSVLEEGVNLVGKVKVLKAIYEHDRDLLVPTLPTGYDTLRLASNWDVVAGKTSSIIFDLLYSLPGFKSILESPDCGNPECVVHGTEAKARMVELAKEREV